MGRSFFFGLGRFKCHEKWFQMSVFFLGCEGFILIPVMFSFLRIISGHHSSTISSNNGIGPVLFTGYEIVHFHLKSLGEFDNCS